MDGMGEGIIEGELIDPEDVPLGETVWVARHLGVSFDGRVGTEQTEVLASGVDCSEAVTAALFVILHARNVWAPDVELRVGVQQVALDPTDPDAEFVGVYVSGTDFFDSQPVPRIEIAPFTVVPPRVRVVLTWVQAEPSSGPQTATISIGLVLRRHVAPLYRVI